MSIQRGNTSCVVVIDVAHLKSSLCFATVSESANKLELQTNLTCSSLDTSGSASLNSPPKLFWQMLDACLAHRVLTPMVFNLPLLTRVLQGKKVSPSSQSVKTLPHFIVTSLRRTPHHRFVSALTFMVILIILSCPTRRYPGNCSEEVHVPSLHCAHNVNASNICRRHFHQLQLEVPFLVFSSWCLLCQRRCCTTSSLYFLS